MFELQSTNPQTPHSDPGPSTFSEFRGRDSALFLEYFIEIVVIRIACFRGHFFNGQLRMLQQLAGFFNPQFRNVFRKGFAQIFFEKLAAVYLVQKKSGR